MLASATVSIRVVLAVASDIRVRTDGTVISLGDAMLGRILAFDCAFAQQIGVMHSNPVWYREYVRSPEDSHHRWTIFKQEAAHNAAMDTTLRRTAPERLAVTIFAKRRANTFTIQPRRILGEI